MNYFNENKGQNDEMNSTGAVGDYNIDKANNSQQMSMNSEDLDGYKHVEGDDGVPNPNLCTFCKTVNEDGGFTCLNCGNFINNEPTQ
mmetsp:Transcript_18286/g.31282  ORF Transcript_18286/g.31282 Transcript_18286/m.31282 type:complete len:87 (+) Transcript_18286:4699-4959(+)